MFWWFIAGLLLGITVGGIIAFRYAFDKGIDTIFALLMAGGMKFDDLKDTSVKGIDKWLKERK